VEESKKNISGFKALRIANIAREKEWDPLKRITLLYRGNELAGEVGEACNVIKKLERERIEIRGTRINLIDLADELADIIICADLVAMQEGIDMEEAVINKFNKTSEKYNIKTRMSNNGLY
jgi:NTP pyrophosphatase (non-canonical NTP hydrolase)